MGDIVNLRRARKQKVRAEHSKSAEANRIKFGRTKAEKVLDKFETEVERRKLDGKRLEE